MLGQSAAARLVRSANSAAACFHCSSSFLCVFYPSRVQPTRPPALVRGTPSTPFDCRDKIRGADFLKFLDKGLHRHHFHSSSPLQANHGSSSMVSQAFSTKMAQDGIVDATKIARQYKQQEVKTEHLMKALLEQKEGLAGSIFQKAGIDNTSLLQTTNEFISRQPKVIGATRKPELGEHMRTLLAKALKFKKEFGDEFVSVEHLVLAFCVDKGFGQQLFNDLKLCEKELQNAVSVVRGNQRVTDQNPEGKYQVLEKYGRDLTELARHGKLDPVIGRDDEIRRCINILLRKSENNLLIIGEPGVGKTAIVEGLAQLIVEGGVPKPLLDTRLISLDIGALVAGAKLRGEFEERLKAVLKEVSSSNGQIILFIDEIHTVVDAGATDTAMNAAANLLKPMLGRGELKCIGATTLNECRKFIEKDLALEGSFEKVYCEQPSVADTILLLHGLRQRYELHHSVKISNDALVAAAVLSDRYITERFLPDKAIDVVDEAAAKLQIERTSKPRELEEVDRALVKLELKKIFGKNDTDLAPLKQKQKELREQWEQEKSFMTKINLIKEEIDRVNLESEAETLFSLLWQLQEVESELAEFRQSGKSLIREEVTEEVTESSIAEVVSKWTGIPISNFQQSEMDKLLHLEERLSKSVVGHEIAVKSIVDAIFRSRVGLSDPNRPISSFMFVGPTGVGKTKLAKALAGCLFNSENALVRIDMSEYMEKHTVARLVGAPPGYVGYEEGGQLTEVVRQRPYSIVLFDEIEKAHRDVLNILLQLLDDGRITDSQGRTVNFKNTVVILTSNIGSHLILDTTLRNTHESEDAVYKLIEKQVLELARRTFRPEFLNRIDKFIVFKPLDAWQNKLIVEMQLDCVKQRLRQKNFFLYWTSAAVELLGNLSFDPNCGARLVKRVIQEMVENDIATGVLRGDFKEDGSIIVDADSLKDVPAQKKLVIKKLETVPSDAICC